MTLCGTRLIPESFTADLRVIRDHSSLDELQHLLYGGETSCPKGQSPTQPQSDVVICAIETHQGVV